VTDRISRPATIEDLKTLLRSLNAHGVEYLLIGGYALAAHGYQRATTDIDCLADARTALRPLRAQHIGRVGSDVIE